MKLYRPKRFEEEGILQQLVWKFDAGKLISNFVLSAPGNLMAIVIDYKDLQIFDLQKEQRIFRKKFSKFPIQDVKFCPKGKWIVVVQSSCKRVSMFHLYKEKKLILQTFTYFLIADDFYFTPNRKDLLVLFDGALYHSKLDSEDRIPIQVYIEQIQYLPENRLSIASQNTINFYMKSNQFKRQKLILLRNKIYLFQSQKNFIGISTKEHFRAFQLRNLQCQKQLRKFNQMYTIYDMHFTSDNRQLIINYGINITLLHLDTFRTVVINSKEHIFEKIYLSKTDELFIMDSENQVKKICLGN